MENITITNTDLTNTIYSDLLNWQYSSQVTTDGKIDYFKFKNENDLVFSNVWIIKMTDEDFNMNDQLVYLYRKSYNNTLAFDPNLTCKQTLSYLREDPYNISITYKFRRKDNPDNVFERTFYGYDSDLVNVLTVSGDEAVKFYQESDEYDVECKIEGTSYGSDWYGKITNEMFFKINEGDRWRQYCVTYKMPGTTLSNNSLPNINSDSYDLVIPFTIDADFLNLEDRGDGWFRLADLTSTLIPYSSTNASDNSLDGNNFAKLSIFVVDYSSSVKNDWIYIEPIASDSGINEKLRFEKSAFVPSRVGGTGIVYEGTSINTTGGTETLYVYPDEFYTTYFAISGYLLNNSGWAFGMRISPSLDDYSVRELWLTTNDTSDINYNFDIINKPESISFHHYNNNISSTLIGGNVLPNNFLYPGSFTDKNLTITQSKSMGVVAGYIRVWNLLISVNELHRYDDPYTSQRLVYYTIHNPYPVPIKVVYSSTIDTNNQSGRDYFKNTIWPSACLNERLNGSFMQTSTIDIESYGSKDITVKILGEYIHNANIDEENYFAISYSLNGQGEAFKYITSSTSSQYDRLNTHFTHTYYCLPANNYPGAETDHLSYKVIHQWPYFIMNNQGLSSFRSVENFSFWTYGNNSHINVNDLTNVSFNTYSISSSLISVEGRFPSSLNSTYISGLVQATSTTFPGYIIWYVKEEGKPSSIAGGITDLMWDKNINAYYFSIYSKLPEWYKLNASSTYRFYYLVGLLGQGTQTSSWKNRTLTKQ